MNIRDLLGYQLKICQVHVDKLNLALRKIEPLYPFTPIFTLNIEDENLAYIELFISRLGKLQDTLGEKVFTFLLQFVGEQVENKTMIDKLNKMEKLGILPSVSWWQDLRKLRNILVHEYPDDMALIADNLNITFVQAKRLLVFWDSLNDYIKSIDKEVST